MKYLFTLTMLFTSLFAISQNFSYNSYEASNDQVILSSLQNEGFGNFNILVNPHDLKIQANDGYKIYEVISSRNEGGVLTVKTSGLIFFIRKGKTVITDSAGNILIRFLNI
jgi:hypothetical protein